MPTLKTSQALFVAWQDPVTSSYHPVGRLANGNESEGSQYEFVYTHGAKEAEKHGFRTFLGFNEFDRVYKSLTLFPFFANRIMSRSRPDFAAHISWLGLTDATANEMTTLARSGGVRATDSLELFQLPTPVLGSGHFESLFMVHRVRHLGPIEQKRILTLQPGEQLSHEHEETNPVDTNAMRLCTEDDVHVGYMPRYLSKDACHLLYNCESFEVFVEKVNPSPAPVQQRLLCRLVSCWPADFKPCAEPTFQPIPTNATPLCD